MEGAEQANTEMDEGHQQHAEDPNHRAEAGSLLRVLNRSPKRQIPYKEEEQEQGQREPGIPGPPGAPDRLRPDGTSREHDSAEDHADFRRGSGKAVQPTIL